MDVVLFGATGMVGQDVLREWFLDPDVRRVLSIGRSATGQQHPKLREIVRDNLFDFTDIAPDLSGYDACFFCLGVSATGKTEKEYRRVTRKLLARISHTLTGIGPSGALPLPSYRVPTI